MISLKKGINLGGWFSQCVKTDEHINSFISREDITNVRKLGFDHVRIPVDYDCFEDEKGNELPHRYAMLHDAVRWCGEEGLNLILDLHKAPGYDFNNAGIEGGNPLFSDAKLQERFLAVWDRLSMEFGRYTNVAFELLNEVADMEFAQPWNELIKRAIKVIRANAKDNTIVYGGCLWNSASTVKLLEKPIDDNVIVTFHYYEPLLFTHQKAPWVAAMDPNLTVHYPGTMEYYKTESAKLGDQGSGVNFYNGTDMGKDFHLAFIQEAIDAGKKLGVPVYCGEFGVIDRAPEKDTVNWYVDVLDVFAKHNIGFAMWSYKEMDFGLIGEHYKQLEEYMKKWNKEN